MITEQQVREVFELVFAVRERWNSEVGGYRAEFWRLNGDTLTFIDEYSEGDTDSMPLLALTDFDAVADPIKEEKRREKEERKVADAEYRRRQYEKLRQEFEG